MPVIKGEKSPSERFAGAEKTYTIEAMMQNGWALQSGTSHFLGQNFAKAFDVMYQTSHGNREFVSATSWGVSTRLLGALIMTHSDDLGLVLPPKVAPLQVVIVPIRTGKANTDEKVTNICENLVQSLKNVGIRCKFDNREDMRHGSKFYEWEQKGVPVRIEIGPRDVEKNSAVLAIRHSREKRPCSLENIPVEMSETLKDIQNEMHQSAISKMHSKIVQVDSYDDMRQRLLDKRTSGFYIAPWKCDKENEAAIKEDCKATIRCYPFQYNQKSPGNGVACFYSGLPATHYALFARAF